MRKTSAVIQCLLKVTPLAFATATNELISDPKCQSFSAALHAQHLIISDLVGLNTQTPRERFSSNHRVCICQQSGGRLEQRRSTDGYYRLTEALFRDKAGKIYAKTTCAFTLCTVRPVDWDWDYLSIGSWFLSHIL